SPSRALVNEERDRGGTGARVPIRLEGVHPNAGDVGVKAALDPNAEPDTGAVALGEEQLSRLDLLLQVPEEAARVLLNEARVFRPGQAQRVSLGGRRVERSAAEREEIGLLVKLPVVV